MIDFVFIELLCRFIRGDVTLCACVCLQLKSMELVKQDGNDSLDMLIRRAVGKDPFLSFPRPDNNPVQLFQLLHNLERPGDWI